MVTGSGRDWRPGGYNNGQKKEEGQYKDGKGERLWTLWDAVGEMIEKSTYKNGVKVK